MRRYGINDPYERMKALTRGNTAISVDIIHDFINELPIPDDVKERLLCLHPSNYTGNAEKLVREFSSR